MASVKSSVDRLRIESIPVPYVRCWEHRIAIGPLAEPRPDWNEQQRRAHTAARALYEAWRAVMLFHLSRTGTGNPRRWRRLQPNAILYYAVLAFEAAIAPLFPDEVKRKTEETE